jgi:hypothetical protein
MATVDIAKQPDKRIAVSREHLESEITEAIKKSAAGCKGFVGVVIERLEPKSDADSNWAIRGVRFGKADRDKVGEVLSTVVDVLQREFTLAENEAAIQQMPKQFTIDINPPRASGKRRRARSGKPLKAADQAPQVPKIDQDSAEVLPKTTEEASATAERLKTESGLH